MIASCISASTKCLVNGDSFIKRNLRKLNKDIKTKDIMVLDNFNQDCPIGKVINSYIEGNYLHILVRIDKYLESTYITPAFMVIDADYNADTDIFIYKDIELISFGTTIEPVDIGLTKFKVIKW